MKRRRETRAAKLTALTRAARAINEELAALEPQIMMEEALREEDREFYNYHSLLSDKISLLNRKRYTVPWAEEARIVEVLAFLRLLTEDYLQESQRRHLRPCPAYERKTLLLRELEELLLRGENLAPLPLSRDGFYGYLRVSSHAQVTGSSFARQRTVIENYFLENGFNGELVFFRDVASAFYGEHLQKNFGKFLTAMREGQLGPVCHLFVEDFDRFSRMGPGKNRPLMHQLSSCGVTMHFIYDKLVLPPTP